MRCSFGVERRVRLVFGETWHVKRGSRRQTTPRQTTPRQTMPTWLKCLTYLNRRRSKANLSEPNRPVNIFLIIDANQEISIAFSWVWASVLTSYSRSYKGHGFHIPSTNQPGQFNGQQLMSHWTRCTCLSTNTRVVAPYFFYSAQQSI
jgi:hypothetical protein